MASPRYFATPPRQARSWVADDVWVRPLVHISTVSDHEATNTGLLDADGNTIWRAPEPMGFQWGGDE